MRGPVWGDSTQRVSSRMDIRLHDGIAPKGLVPVWILGYMTG